MWAQFSQNSAVALEVLRTEAHNSNLSTWLPRNKTLPSPQPTKDHQPLAQQGHSLPSHNPYMYSPAHSAPDPQHTQQQLQQNVPHARCTGIPSHPPAA